MVFNQFNGIRPIIEGLVDSDYHNCVPTGSSVVERTNYERVVGGGVVEFAARYGVDNYLITDTHNEVNLAYNLWRAGNVDFLKCVQVGDLYFSFYVSKPEYVDVTQADNTKLWFHRVFVIQHQSNSYGVSFDKCWSTPIVFTRRGFTIDSETISVAMSGTSPRYLFFGIEGCCTYWINVDDTKSYSNISYKTARVVGAITNPNVFTANAAETDDNTDKCVLLKGDAYDNAVGGSDPNFTHTAFKNVEWYDNKLVISYDNSVWMTKTDPTSLVPEDWDTASYEWKKYGVDNLWTNAYKSTLSCDKLAIVKACYGQLFFINEKSIEMWTRSGNESDPLNPVSSYVTNVDIVKCDVLDGRMVALINDCSKLRVVLIDAQGNANKISNSAVDSKLGDMFSLNYDRFTTISQNNETHIALYKKGEDTTTFLCFNPVANTWYTLEYSNGHAPLYQVGKYAINTSYGYLKPINVCEEGLLTKYHRYFIDCGQQFTARRLFGNVEVIGQFGYGFSTENDDHITLNVSNTNGKTWSREFTRKPPRLGQLQPKVTFAGLGSGENILVKLSWENLKPYTIIGMNINVR